MADAASSKNDLARAVLLAYPTLPPGRLEYLAGAGGYSGARFWRLETAAAAFCLRRWPPEHPSADRLAFQHAVLRHARRRQVDFVPVPIPTNRGETFISYAGHFWELTQWLPGVADFFPEASREKLSAASKALAQFHVAVADFPHGGGGEVPRQGVVPSVRQRGDLVDQWQAQLGRLATAIEASPPNRLRAYAEETLSLFGQARCNLREQLRVADSIRTRLQPAIRDVWSDHILFNGSKVTGIVDFGAMRIDSPAVDIARLLGSMARDDGDAWESGLNSYEQIRRLSRDELTLIEVFDRSTVVLSGMNWLRWIFLEGREFEDFDAISARLDVTLARLRHLISRRQTL